MMREQQRSNQRWVWIGVAVAAATGVASCGFFTHVRPPSGSGAVGTGDSDGGDINNNNNGSRDGGGGEVVLTDGGTPPIVKMSCGDVAYGDPWSPGYTPDPAVLMQVQQTLGSMSLSDKAGQLRGTSPGGNTNYSDIFRTPDNTTKGVRGFLFRDGPRGVNLAAQLPAGKNGWSTSFPSPIARGAAFDMDLEYKIGQAAGDETIASGNTMLLAPTINILRHPAWGRAQETYGEDSYHLGRIGTAFVAGVQEYVPVCVKHYAANNIENGRGSANAQMDEQTLREIYARHFEMVIKDGGAACIMAAYNGKKATQNKHLLNDILRDDFGFRGFVMSDWWAMPPGTAGSTTDALAANAGEALLAGMDMELPWSYNYQQIEAVTGAGKPVPESVVTQAASRVLEAKYRFKVAKVGQPAGLKAATTTLSAQGSIENNADHIALAHRAAVESMVLLKNDNHTLPISRTTVKKIAVIGANVSYAVVNTDQATGTIHFATDPRLGDLGSSRVFADPAKSSGPFKGIQEVAGGGITVTSGADASIADAADFVVVVAGLTPEDEGEEYTRAGDRPNFALDGKKGTPTQNPLIAQIAAKHKPMVVVLEGGSVIDMPWLNDVPAVVMAWYPGMDGGRALGELLFGDANFSGKLPITWPKSWNDEPQLSGGSTTVMDYDLGYRRFDRKGIAPLFPFGFGLSYTTFTYSNLQIGCTDVTHGGVVDVYVDLTNSGTVKGDETTFVFVSFPDTKGRRSVKELKAFRRTTLEAGQGKQIKIPLRVSDLKYWDSNANKWSIENGSVQIMVGGSAADLTLKDTVVVK
jgi:beta-glucosidase